MKGVVVTFCGLQDEEKKILLRYLVAYNGDVSEDINEKTTHVVTDKIGHDEKQVWMK